MIGKQSEDQREDEVFVVKALTHKQLCQMYGVSWLTFQNWMKKVEHEVGKKTGHFYHVHQVKRIFQIFGMPKQLNVTVNDMDEIYKSLP